jgi:tetratricopeptide (TPR) repeat protein
MRWRIITIFLFILFFCFGFVGPFEAVRKSGEIAEKSGRSLEAIAKYKSFLSLLDSVGLRDDARFPKTFDRLIYLCKKTNTIIDFYGKPVSKDSLCTGFMESYSRGEFLNALYLLEMYMVYTREDKALLPFRAYLWEMVGVNERAENYYKKYLKQKTVEAKVLWAAFLRRTKRFELAYKFVADELKSDSSGIYLNEMGLLFYDWSKALGGKGEYLMRSFDFFSRTSHCVSVDEAQDQNKPRIDFAFTMDGPDSEGVYRFGVKLIHSGGQPIIITEMIPYVLLLDGFRKSLKPINIEQIVELFSTAYIAPMCTLSSPDSAFSFDFDALASLDSTRFPARTGYIYFKLVYLDKSFRSDTIQSDIWLFLGNSKSPLDSLIATAFRRASRLDSITTIDIFQRAFADSVEYPGLNRNRWRAYLSMWLQLENMEACQGNLVKVDSILNEHPDDLPFHLIRGAFHLLCSSYELAEREFRFVLENDPYNKWAHYNLGLIAYLRGEAPRALGHFRQAISIDEGFADAYLNAGIIMEEMGQKVGARTYYERYLQLGGKRAQEVRQWINALKE